MKRAMSHGHAMRSIWGRSRVTHLISPFMSAPVYLDYNATTPVDPAVREAMLPYLGEHFGNPSSSHAYGQRAREVVEVARAEVAALIGAHSDEVVFTGGATESNNLAVQGVARAVRAARRHLVTSARSSTLRSPAPASAWRRTAGTGPLSRWTARAGSR